MIPVLWSPVGSAAFYRLGPPNAPPFPNTSPLSEPIAHLPSPNISRLRTPIIDSPSSIRDPRTLESGRKCHFQPAWTAHRAPFPTPSPVRSRSSQLRTSISDLPSPISHVPSAGQEGWTANVLPQEIRFLARTNPGTVGRLPWRRMPDQRTLDSHRIRRLTRFCITRNGRRWSPSKWR